MSPLAMDPVLPRPRVAPPIKVLICSDRNGAVLTCGAVIVSPLSFVSARMPTYEIPGCLWQALIGDVLTLYPMWGSLMLWMEMSTQRAL